MTFSDDERQFMEAYRRIKAKPGPVFIPYKKMPTHLDYKPALRIDA